MAAAAPAAAAAKGGSNPITTPMTYAQLQAEAEAQAAASISSQNAPLQAQVTTLGGQKTNAYQDIVQQGKALLPFVQSNANAVDQSEQNALSMEQSVFAAAGTRYNQLQQSQAAEAQQLAQQMGGPVSTGSFTQALEPYGAAIGNMQGAGMLNALGAAQQGTQEAHAFAGQVFPALMTEEEAKSDAFYNDQIKTLQNQIDANAGTKSDLVNKNLADLLDKERQFELNVKTQQMDKTKMARDWQVQQHSMHAQDLQEKLAKQAAKRAGISLGQRQQTINIERQHVSAEEKLAAQRMGLSVAEFQQRVQHEKQTARVGQARMSASLSKDAASAVQAAMAGGGKPVSHTTRDYIPKGSLQYLQAQSGKMASAYYDAQASKKAGYPMYYRVVHETTMGPQAHPITDPNHLYNLIRGTYPQLGRKATINLIRAQTNMRGWSPGKQMQYTGSQLHSMTLPELEGLARDSGYKGKYGVKNRQAITDFLLHR